MVSFNCPHCGLPLEAPREWDGETLTCPRCEGAMTLQLPSVKQVLAASAVGLGLAALAAFFGFDD